jgi:hypothetical protein
MGIASELIAGIKRSNSLRYKANRMKHLRKGFQVYQPGKVHDFIDFRYLPFAFLLLPYCLSPYAPCFCA